MNSKEYPQEYDFDKYVSWHEKNIPEDKPLVENLNKFRNELKKEYREYFKQLGQLLSQIESHCKKEIKIQFKDIVKGEYKIPIEDYIADEINPAYDNLFKSVSSIVDKLWRYNYKLENNYVSLANIKNSIKDLARTSVICPSLLYAKFYSDRLEKWNTIIEEPDRNTYIPAIQDVTVDGEAKLASGYFAYHSSIIYSNNNIIEVQVYSQLSSIWRNLSHIIYERSRLGINEKEGFGKTNTRLVSLGHMLHLAECEIERIQKEIIPK